MSSLSVAEQATSVPSPEAAGSSQLNPSVRIRSRSADAVIV
jgi:hypothetical protein